MEQELLAYLDGALDARTRSRVEAHLKECPTCTAELARLKRQRLILGQVFKIKLGEKQLPAAADRRIRTRLRQEAEPRREWWWAWRGGLTQVALAFMAVAMVITAWPFLSPSTSPAVLPTVPPRTEVMGQSRLAPGSRAAMRIVVREQLSPQPVSGAEIEVRLGKVPGLAALVYRGRTDAEGMVQAAFTVPEELEGAVNLVVKTVVAGQSGEIVRPIVVVRSARLFLNSDKPVYRPGQELFVRALALDAMNLRPVVGGQVAFDILDSKGRSLNHQVLRASDYGVAAFTWKVADDYADKSLTLRATISDTVSERQVMVGAYPRAAFRLNVEPGRTFYAPGNRVTGTVQADYFFGKAVADAMVRIVGRQGGAAGVIIADVSGRTDALGRFDFTFNLPLEDSWRELGGQPDILYLTVSATDSAGRTEGVRREMPVSRAGLLIQAVPERGSLKPGVENIIYISTAYPDGQPAATEMEIMVGDVSYQVATDSYGMGEFRLKPLTETVMLEIVAHDEQGQTGARVFNLASFYGSKSVLVRTDGAIYRVGDTLHVEALTAGEIRQLYLDVLQAGQSVAMLSGFVEEGRAAWAIDLDSSLAGTLELHVYAADDETLEDSRSVVVDPANEVAVQVTADRAVYRPGEQAHLQFQTTLTESGKSLPAQALLGVGVVDASVYALEQLPVGFARTYFLLDKKLSSVPQLGFAVDQGLAAGSENRAVRLAQSRAAEAAWALAGDSPIGERRLYALSVSYDVRSSAQNQKSPSDGVRRLLAGILLILAIFLWVVVIQTLFRLELVRAALPWMGGGMVFAFLVSPLLFSLTSWLVNGLVSVLGNWMLLVFLIPMVGLWGFLWRQGWRRQDVRLQEAMAIVGAYGICESLLIVLTRESQNLAEFETVVAVFSFLVLLGGMLLLGASLWFEGHRKPAGWSLALVIVWVMLSLALPSIPAISSRLTQTLGEPVLYAGPLGWLSGCAAPMSPTAAPTTEAPAVEEPTEAATEEATEAPTEEATQEIPTAAPTAAPPTATPVPTPGIEVPMEPFPLRQFFPETLYWNAAAETDAEGRWDLDLPLGDNVTTWRVTALASTQDGALGAVVYDLPVSQDFFMELNLPETVRSGAEVTGTATLHNYSQVSQTVQVQFAPADWYEVQVSSGTVTLGPGQVVAVDFVLKAGQVGKFTLLVKANGEGVQDALAREVVVHE